MKNLRRLALVTGIAALSAVAFSPKAQAQTANVDFNGSVGPTCTINSVTNGTLVQGSGSQAVAMIANGTIGTPGNINVTCLNGTTFAITGITDNGSILTNGTYANSISAVYTQINDGATVVARGSVSPNSTNGNLFVLGTAGSFQPSPITNKNYPVLMELSTNAPNLSSGLYKVRVSVALTPQ
jgi:hypothetical protein